MTGSPILETIGISKSFPGVKALQNVDFRLFPGEIHTLMGHDPSIYGSRPLALRVTMYVLKDHYPYDEGSGPFCLRVTILILKGQDPCG